NYRDDLAAEVDRYHTDIAAALKLALASFPEGTGRRVVLMSDGNENLGDALAQARLAKTNGVEIDVVPLAAGLRAGNEVLVRAGRARPRVEEEARVPVRVLVRNATRPERDVRGTLELRQRREGSDVLVAVPIAPNQPGVAEGPPGAPAVVLLK